MIAADFRHTTVLYSLHDESLTILRLIDVARIWVGVLQSRSPWCAIAVTCGRFLDRLGCKKSIADTLPLSVAFRKKNPGWLACQ